MLERNKMVFYGHVSVESTKLLIYKLSSIVNTRKFETPNLVMIFFLHESLTMSCCDGEEGFFLNLLYQVIYYHDEVLELSQGQGEWT